MAIGIQICPCLIHSDHRSCDQDETCHKMSATVPQPTTGTANSSYISGRDLSKFDQDILKILCAVLMKTGPVHITGRDIATLDVEQLVVEAVANEDKYIVSYGEVE